jgi:cysteine synthase
VVKKGGKMKYENIVDSIGKTPLVKIQKLNPLGEVEIYAKLEGVNPGGSVKDRIAKHMIEEAERKGLLEPGRILVEATSGNTGLGLAMIAAARGYRFVAVMPESASLERRKLLRAYGAEIVLTKAEGGTNWAIKVAQRIVREDRRYLMLDQFNNQMNVLAHYETTGREIVAQLPGVDVFVAGMGTGGTLMGVGRRLKEHNLRVKIVGVEPHPKTKLQGLRNMRVYRPSIFDWEKVDLNLRVKDEDGFRLARALFLKEGISVGISSGAAMWGALEMAQRIKKGKIVTLFPDRGDKYVSTSLFED